jgi:hypothetical protein
MINTSAANFDVLSSETPQERVVAYIETSLGCIVNAIQVRPDGLPSITLKRIRDVKGFLNPVTQRVERKIVDREVKYGFPGKNKDDAWRFGR